MPKVEGTDIPLGFEAVFFQIFEWANIALQDKLNKRWGATSRYRRPDLAQISLMVRWRDIYNGLSLERKSGWTAYWLTLPFGSHSGLNGWPGSGFSAFIYENAPRYAAGLPLLLDAPIGLGPELLSNPSFTFSGANWEIDYADWDPGVYKLYTYDGFEYDAFIKQSVGVLDAGLYRVGALMAVPNGISGSLSFPLFGPGDYSWGAGLATDGGGLTRVVAGNGNGNVAAWYYHDVEPVSDPVESFFEVRALGSPDQGVISVYEVSLRKYT